MGCTFTALVLRGRDRACAACRRHPRLSAARRPPCLLTTDHVREGTRQRPLQHPDPRARRRDRSAARLRHASRWRCTTASCCAATACTAVLTPEAIADIMRERSASEDSARALVAAALECRQYRQLYRDGGRRRRAADCGIGRCRLRHYATAADPGAGRRRDDRRLRAQSAGVGRPLYPPVRRDR